MNRQLNMGTTRSVHGCLMILLLVATSIGFVSSQKQGLEEQLEAYHPLPYLHGGVVRDFESLQDATYSSNDGGIIDSVIPDSKSRRSVLENIDDSDRSLQNEIGFCYDALYLADGNQDGEVDADEFVTFAQIMGPGGFLPDVETYQQLPLILQSNFIILACLCLQIPSPDGSGIDPQCCAVDPHIDITGTQPGTVPTARQSQYLYQVCFLTETSIDRLLLSAAPTPDPNTRAPIAITAKPTGEPTDKATDKPSRKPSLKPVVPPSDAPTLDPTANPTLDPTPGPTVKPSMEPTIKLTGTPTSAPTDVPTPDPSIGPTPAPSQGPSEKLATGTPTVQPTAKPTAQPTHAPTLEPTVKPSSIPTDVPSVKPTEAPTDPAETLVPTANITAAPSLAPVTSPPTSPEPTTQAPTVKPTIEDDDVTSFPAPTAAPLPVTEAAFVEYGIAITNGRVEEIPPSAYSSDLVKSMDIVAEDVATSFTFGELENDRRRLRRKLETVTSVNLPTAIDFLSDTDCPGFVAVTDECQTVTANIQLNIAGSEDPRAVVDSFQDSLNAAIESGALQAALIEVNPNSVVTITTGFATLSPTDAPTPPPTNGSPIGGGGIAGIVLAGIGGIILACLIIGSIRRRGSEEISEHGGMDVPFADDVEEAGVKPVEVRKAEVTDISPTTGGGPGSGVAAIAAAAVVGAAAVGAISSDKKKKESDDASSAGESGWSSNQDGSSANTSIDASLDSIPQTNFSGIVLGDAIGEEMATESEDKGTSVLATPTKLEASGEQDQSGSPSTSLSPQSQSQENSLTGTTGTDGSMQSTYSELDDAIQKGDWAAVGVTAALLASQSYVDDNTQGSSKGTILKRPNTALNPERAAELDRLVETGDWEGVVAAAAKFDAQEALRGDAQSSQNSESGSAVDSTGGGSSSALSGSGGGGSSVGTAPSNMSGSQTIDTTTSPSTYTATGLTATSDTASTRSKARKLNEIRDEVEALVTAVVPEEADNVDEMMTQFRGREEELVETLKSMKERQVAQKARKESQKQAKREAKEYIQDRKSKETFDAVDNTGNAADDEWMNEIENAQLESSDATQAMKDQLKEAISNENWENVAQAAAGLSGHTPTKSRASSKDNESVDSVDINALVDEGDWDGVVAAASRYAESSTNTSSSKQESEELADDSTIEQRRKRREERLREEEEALAQAEIWDAIADQTKVEDSEDQGGSGTSGAAKMAADWAIDQSLAALKKAEEENDDEDNDDESL
eukprot:CAMPEP_0116148754 /NCGR_PEP_ID=MMETSP0329-20121206/18552_1 /TAXON_ID=697910 /ORGANISM="Pseudo-nitzschia arenysensis, Strain B593" /LENGTH=1247 /DNA_ID=CAMNT_0003644961 /DNA_START=214 /DNA_END=3957 /DNA_ORIENTATION=+